MSERDLVFVSYSHHDAAYRDKLKVMLKPWMRRGVQYWADDYIPVGDRWERSIDAAIRRARVGVLLVSPRFIDSDFIFEKELPPLLAAHEAGQLTLVCVAVSAADFEAAGLALYQFSHDTKRPLDLMSEAEQHPVLVDIARKIAAAFGAQLKPAPTYLVAAVRWGEPLKSAHGTQLGLLHGVPELPKHYIQRDLEMTALKRALLEGREAALGIVGIKGLGGIGKSVLAAALGRDLDVRRAFPDGVFFIPFGQTPEITRLQNAFAGELGESEARICEPFPGRDKLRELLKHRACLLVLDDVWQYEHALAFDVAGTRSRTLVTTRDAQLLGALGARTHDLGVLSPEASLQILAEGAGTSVDDLSSTANAVAEECGHLPLALALAAAQVRDGVTLADVLAALERGKLEFLDHPSGSVWKSLRASVAALSELDSARYRELVVVPEDTAVPASVIACLWKARAGLEPFESHQLLARLAGKSLLFLHGEDTSRTVTFHDLQLDYLTLLSANDRQTLHGALLDAVALKLPRDESGAPIWAALGEREKYIWQHLGHHLFGAGRLEALQSLPCDLSWLQAKLAVSGPAELLRELERIAERVPCANVSYVERALRLDASWLHRDPSALAGLLYNRLRCVGFDAAAIAASVLGLDPALRLRHPIRLDMGERRIFHGHAGAVASCAYSPDGTRILSASKDHTLREWDARTGQELRRIDGHADAVNACAYSSDGTRILSASKDETLREWDVRTGQQLRRFDGHAGAVLACAYSPDGFRVLSASRDKTLREWDVRTGKQIRSLIGHSASVSACAYRPDGARILSASWDKTLREWDAATGRELARFDGHTNSVSACAYHPDGARILSASWDHTLREWDAVTGRELRRLDGHTGGVYACVYGQGGSRILSSSDDHTLREWDAVTGQELRRLDGHTGGIYACAYGPDGARILSGSRDRTLREWDASTAPELRGVAGHAGPVTVCACSPDGRRILSGSRDKTLREWDASTGHELRHFDGHTGSVTACVYSPDGKRVLSGSSDHELREWDASTGQELQRFHATNVSVCAYAPDGTRILSSSEDATLREWSARTGQELRRLRGHTGVVVACAYSPDGARILSASKDKTLREWDASTGLELGRFDGHTSAVSGCAYSPDGASILSSSSDHTLREWDARRPERGRFDGHGNAVSGCAYSPDGARILSGSWDNTLREWAADSGQMLARFDGHTRPVNTCVYSPDGARILSGADDWTLREWDTRTGQELRRFHGHTNGILACAYSPDGARILSASRDRSLREWDAHTTKLLRRFDGHADAVNACSYSQDGSRILSGSSDNTLREWDSGTGQMLKRFHTFLITVTTCAYSPDGSRIISGCRDGSLLEWDVRAVRPSRYFYGHKGVVSACTYSPDGTRILSASHDNTLREWDALTGQVLGSFTGHAGRVYACAYRADGFRILSASEDHTLREWNARTGKLLGCIDASSAVRRCAYTPDGRYVAALSDNSLSVWRRTAGRRVATVYGIAPFTSIALAASLIVAGDDLGNVWILDWDPDKLA